MLTKYRRLTKKIIANIIWNNKRAWWYNYAWFLFPHYRCYVLKDYNLTRKDFLPLYELYKINK